MTEQNKRVITHLIPMDEQGGLQDPVYFLVSAEEIFIDTPEGEKLLTEVLNNQMNQYSALANGESNRATITEIQTMFNDNRISAGR